MHIFFRKLVIAGLLFIPAGISAEGKAIEPSTDLISASTYGFSVQSGVNLEDMSAGTTQLIGPGTDNDNSALYDLGFLLRFDGTNYTDFGVNGNGALVLGRVWSGQNTNNQINFGSSANLMPYWDDLCVGSSGKVHYKTTGSPGNRKMVVEWLNMKIARGTACDGTGSGTFQLWMFERRGVIQFVYGNGMVQSATNGGYSVGIHAGASTNFASVTTSSGTASYTTTNDIQIASINTGTAYLFTPPVPAAPTAGSITEITQTTLKINWTDNATNETGYIVRRSTDGVNYEIIAVYPANATSDTDAGLTPSTQYFYLVNAVTDGGFSEDLALSATTGPPRNINSTPVGGPWSVPSTWEGGIIPDFGDKVAIVSGATVIIDTTAKAGSLIVGGAGNRGGSKDISAEGGTPAILRFGETATFTLSVLSDVTIGANDSFTTGGGNANQHVLYVGGDLINNGTLDFNTNNNLAGATIAFNGSGNAVFEGTGAITDVFAIIISKDSMSTVELAPTNFTVGGSSIDTPASGYLIIVSGTFKISGTFSGSHRTFPSATYDIPHDGGLWLSNPNYTITGQHGTSNVRGVLRVSAGAYNAGTAIDDSMLLREGSTVIVEGGSVGTAGVFADLSNGSLPLSYSQTGGTVTTCIRGTTSSEGCFLMGTHGVGQTTYSITGGKIVIQNPSQVGHTADFWCAGGCFPDDAVDATVQFGNSDSLQPALFIARGPFPKLVIDTAVGGHILNLKGTGAPFTGASAHTLEIGTGGTLDIGSDNFTITGETFINNGTIKGIGSTLSRLTFTGVNTVMSGTGGTGSSLVYNVEMRGHSLTNISAGSFRSRVMRLVSGSLFGANKFILGNNDSLVSYITIGDDSAPGFVGAFDSAPVFDLGNGGQGVSYSNTGPSYTTGPEINPGRGLVSFRFSSANTDTLTIAGELTVKDLDLARGRVIANGPNDIVHFGALVNFGQGYVYGTLIRKFTSDQFYSFPVGINSRTSLGINAVITSNPAYMAVTPTPGPLPGLLPATAVSEQWMVSINGILSGTLSFFYDQADARGNESSYKIWFRSPSGLTTQVPSNPPDTAGNIISTSGSTSNLTGRWGIGAQLDPGPVSISGTITTSGGQPISNALVTISGGNLPAPIDFQTGNFGTYSFSGLQAGETYTVRVDAKRFRFSPNTQQVTPFGNVGNVNFIANPQE